MSLTFWRIESKEKYLLFSSGDKSWKSFLAQKLSGKESLICDLGKQGDALCSERWGHTQLLTLVFHLRLWPH